MLTLKEEAVSMLQNVPDDKMKYVVDMLKLMTGILDNQNILFSKPSTTINTIPSEAANAWNRFKAYKGIIPYEIDAKEELASARDEKYADFT
jgi:hypothetical protein